MTTTEIVYIVGPSYSQQMCISLYTLLQSGTTFDSVRIFFVGKRPKHLRFRDSRIIVDEVKSLDTDFFLINKTYVTQSKAERVVFLDADTLVLKCLDSVWQGVTADFIARVDSGAKKNSWKQQRWEETLQKVGASPDSPYFNSGFFICQNGSHKHLSPIWHDFVVSGLKDELFDANELQNSKRLCEQIALSLAIGAKGLSYHKMSEKEHGFAWIGESYQDKDLLLHHTGSYRLFQRAACIESETNLNFASPITVNRFNPTYLGIQWKLLNYKKWRILTKLFGFTEAEKQIKAMLAGD